MRGGGANTALPFFFYRKSYSFYNETISLKLKRRDYMKLFCTDLGKLLLVGCGAIAAYACLGPLGVIGVGVILLFVKN